MFGGHRKTVSWKGDETAGAGAGGLEEVREYQVEEGNSTMRKVKKRGEEERKRAQEQFQDPEKKQDVTDDKFLFEVPGVPSLNYFPLFLDKEQEERIQQAKENGRHKFATKGRFVPWQGLWKQ